MGLHDAKHWHFVGSFGSERIVSWASCHGKHQDSYSHWGHVWPMTLYVLMQKLSARTKRDVVLTVAGSVVPWY